MNIFADNGEGILAAADPPGSGCNCPDALGVVQHHIEGQPIPDCPTHGEHPDSPTPAELDPLAVGLLAALASNDEETSLGGLLAHVDHLNTRANEAHAYPTMKES